MIKVYIAGPFTIGDKKTNIDNAIDAADRVAAQEMLPFIPHLFDRWNDLIPHTYDYWMQLDRAWLLNCDVLLRLPGDSPGADQEVSDALAYGLYVVHSYGELLELRDRLRGE